MEQPYDIAAPDEGHGTETAALENSRVTPPETTAEAGMYEIAADNMAGRGRRGFVLLSHAAGRASLTRP